jgi:hypothetical protein
MDDRAENPDSVTIPPNSLRYAIETLEIEKHRLSGAIREMRAIPMTGENYPGTRIREHKKSIEDVELAIAVLRNSIEASERIVQLEVERGKKRP